MSPWEARAWLSLWGMVPAYVAYFALQIVEPGWPGTILGRFAVLAAAAGVHGVVYVVGLVVMKRGEQGEDLMADERDRAIDARGTRSAYFVLLAGAILFGMIMPFRDSGWSVVNVALLFIVLSEAVRNAMIVIGYRRNARLAY